MFSTGPVKVPLFGPIGPLSHSPASDVEVCITEPTFVHVTRSPTTIVRFGGSKTKSLMRAFAVEASARCSATTDMSTSETAAIRTSRRTAS